MSDQIQKAESKPSLLKAMAAQYNLEAGQFLDTVKNTVMPSNANQAQMVAFLSVADQYGLNPFTKEIYAFPAKGGGIQPMVPIDGWLKMINQHPAFDGMSFDFHHEGGELVSCTCTIHRKDRSHPFVVTEFLEECKMNTEPWNKKPRRMLMHKAAIQAARYAFSFSGLIDEDEAQMYDQMATAESAVGVASTESSTTDTTEIPKTGTGGLLARLESDETVEAEFEDKVPDPAPAAPTESDAGATDESPVDDGPQTARGALFFDLREYMGSVNWTKDQVLDHVAGLRDSGERPATIQKLTNDELVRVIHHLRGLQ